MDSFQGSSFKSLRIRMNDEEEAVKEFKYLGLSVSAERGREEDLGKADWGRW